ncbi:unnamed protein product [Brassicogethes aeneus]|uniref:Uncharacterized protein n=1 Tax=Brassicogethes aeneus TaxID=1431903 RepID=A0A9P0FP66_BRAAE|nr:unnamed protein product [Brassicogethes aeneus]
MATSSEFSAELLKLKKDHLVEIILNKCVPSTISVSEELRRHVEDTENDGTSKLAKVNLENNIPFIKLESELKLTKVELECSKEIIATLKTTVSDKELIITLLQKSKQINSAQMDCSVADAVKKSSNQGNQENQRTNINQINCGVANGMKIDSNHGKQNQPTNYSGNQGKSQEPINKNKAKVVGSNEKENVFKSAPKRAVIHLGRVNLNTSPEDIKNYVVTTFKRNDFNIEPCPVREGAKSISFRIETDISILEELYLSENWPKGVLINRYRFFRNQTAAAEFK